MRKLVLVLLCLPILSQAQIEISTGFGINRRIAKNDLFWGSEQQDKLADQMFTAYQFGISKKLGHENNTWHLGIKYRSIGVMSTIVRFPAVRGWGSGGSAEPAYEIHQRRRYNFIGFSASYEINQSPNHYYLSIDPMYQYLSKNVTVTNTDGHDKQIVISKDNCCYGSPIKFNIGFAYEREIKTFKGLKVGAEISAMPYEFSPIVLLTQAQLSLRQEVSLSSRHN